VNQAFETITGYARNEILGQPCTTLSCSACKVIRESEDGHFCLMFKKRQLRMQKCLLMRNGGGYVYIIKNASVLKDSDGNVTGAVETITDITDLVEKETQIETFRRELQAEDRFHGLLGATVPMQRVFDLVINAANSDAPVIIYGESGTGKDLVAQAIHASSIRKNKPYVKVNCAALNESLLESELFGHVKGAFTGAHRNRKGRFEAAKGGDIFLDEIGDLPLSTQVKLLRVLEEKVIERVGDNRPIHIDARIISATNQNLMQLVEQDSFREDLFYRINVIPVWMPPLRERMGDIPLLAEAFFRRIQLKSGKTIQGISNEALEILMKYSWPGNVRELKSAFEYAFVSCPGSMIGPEHFPPNIIQPETLSKPKEKPSLSLNEIKKQRLVDALQKSGGNQSQAARILGISRTSVWNQIRRFNIKL
jgi:PAS domain S-box-containing protein